MNTKTLSFIIALVFVSSVLFAQSKDCSNENSIPAYVEFSSQNDTKAKQNERLEHILKLQEGVSVVETNTLIDNAGGKHISYTELYRGIKVENTRCTMHYDKQGNLNSINGNFFVINDIATTPTIAIKDIVSTLGDAEQFKGKSITFKSIQDNEDYICIYKDDDKQYLAYKLYAEEKEGTNSYVYVDAHSGKIIDIISANYGITASVLTLYSGVRTIETEQFSNGYKLCDYTRGNGIITKDYHTNNWYTSYSQDWSTMSLFDRAALDAHWAVEMAFDYYQNTFGRYGYDNQGSAINIIVNNTSGGFINNASWNNLYKTISCGLNELYRPMVSLDIIAHEYTHAVTSTSSQLNYRGESGAINEGLSDIFAVCIERYAKPNNSPWSIGEEVGPANTRYISNPTCSYYKGPNWYTGNDNSTEVHINCGVMSFWFYQLANGFIPGFASEHPQLAVQGVGLDAVAEICYLMNTAYLTPSSDYQDAMRCSVLAANALGYGSNIINQIYRAWYNVGIFAPIGEINGPSSICNDAVLSLANNYGLNVTWSVNNNNVIIVSGQNTDNVLIRKVYDGWATIEACLRDDSGNVIGSLYFTVCCGTPDCAMNVIPVSANGEEGYWRSDLYGNTIILDKEDDTLDYPAYEVSLYRISDDFASQTLVNRWNVSSIDAIPFGYFPQGFYEITVRGISDCGTSNYVSCEFESCDSWGMEPLFSMNYNSASQVINVSCTKAQDEEIEVQLWDGYTLKSSTRTNAQSINIPTQSVTGRVGIVKVKLNGKTESKGFFK